MVGEGCEVGTPKLQQQQQQQQQKTKKQKKKKAMGALNTY